MRLIASIARIATAGALAISITTGSMAQSYPSQPIKWLIPFAAGGGSDTAARIIAEDLEKRLGQPVVVENKPGGNGMISLQALMTAAPDGHTIMTGGDNLLTVNPHLFKDAQYDVTADFEYVGMFGLFPLLMVARKDFPGNNAAEVFDLIRKSKGDLTFASFGPSSGARIFMEVLAYRLGGKLTAVSYAGAAPASVDVLGGRVDLMIADVPTTLPHIQAGNLKAVAWTGKDGNSILPDVPSIAQAGVEGYDLDSWQGLIAPKGTSTEIIGKLSEALQATLNESAIQEALLARGVTPFFLSPADFKARVVSGSEEMKTVVEGAGLAEK